MPQYVPLIMRGYVADTDFSRMSCLATLKKADVEQADEFCQGAGHSQEKIGMVEGFWIVQYEGVAGNGGSNDGRFLGGGSASKDVVRWFRNERPYT